VSFRRLKFENFVARKQDHDVCYNETYDKRLISFAWY